MPIESSGFPVGSEETDLRESPEFREMQMRAEAAEAKLRRIYNTPLWRYTKAIRKAYASITRTIERKDNREFKFKVDPSEGVPVVKLLKNNFTIEQNNADLTSKSIAIVAHYSKDLKISESLSKYISGLVQNSYAVILASACESVGELQIDADLKSRITIIRKPNLGYDFGSWAAALEIFPEILLAEELILTNDSLIGPFDNFDNLLKSMSESKFDITGVTDSGQLQYHLQSYLLHFKKQAIKNENVMNFLKSVVHLNLKNDVILKYELGLTRTAQLSGLYVGAVFPWNLVVKPGKNPSLSGWLRMFDLGFPFLKREAVRLSHGGEIKLMISEINKRYKDSKFGIEEIKRIH